MIVLVCMCARVFAGSLEPPAGPESPLSAMYTIEAVYQRLLAGTDGEKRTGGFRGPTAPPGSTMHNLNDVMAKAPSNVVDAATTNDVRSDKIFWGLTTNEWGTRTGTGTRTLSADTSTVNAGYYEATNLTLVDTNLVSNNIRAEITIFGVAGAVYSPVPRTGQTNTYEMEDYGADGALQKGVAWPIPRFTVQGDTNAPSDVLTNCVLDNMTGLMWARNAYIPNGTMDWTNSLRYCSTNLNVGAGYGGTNDWRLPNVKELYSLIDCGHNSPPLPSDHPFNNVQGNYYWTSTTMRHYGPGYAWYIHLSRGEVAYAEKTVTSRYLWPVRGP